jgi:hypothetical protein
MRALTALQCLNRAVVGQDVLLQVCNADSFDIARGCRAGVHLNLLGVPVFTMLYQIGLSFQALVTSWALQRSIMMHFYPRARGIWLRIFVFDVLASGMQPGDGLRTRAPCSRFPVLVLLDSMK